MKDTNTASLEPIVHDLNAMYGELNEKLFSGKLEQAVLTVSPDNTKGAYGWMTHAKAWKADTMTDETTADRKNFKDGYHEINLCAEHLSRPIAEVAGTLLHEMVHLYNYQRGVKDTSRQGWYHNEAYRKAAESVGLIVEKTEKYGWSTTRLNDELKTWAEENFTKFSLSRRVLNKKQKKTTKSHSIKYVCPCCGNSVRATKPLSVRCDDCDELMTIG